MLAIDGGKPVRENFLIFGQPVLGDEEIAEVVETLKSRWIGTGPRTHQFEREFAAYIGASDAYAVNSCTAGLHLALLASGVTAGDEVLVTAMTFAATANVIVHSGARPVFVDIDPDTLNIDIHDLERKITDRSRAVMVVHYGGLPANVNAVNELASRYGLKVIEDAAHAVGASINGRRIGAGENLTVFSFYANKNMTTAEGGMITGNHLTEETREFLATMRLHGLGRDAWKRFQSKALVHAQVVNAGFKYNMTDIQAALGIHQLRKVEDFLSRRESIAERFRRELSEIPGIRFQSIPNTYGRLRHGLHLFVLVLDPKAFSVDRDQIVQALRAENIGAAIHYTSLPLEPYYAKLVPEAAATTPVANHISENVLSLPLCPDFTQEDQSDIIAAVYKVCRHYRR